MTLAISKIDNMGHSPSTELLCLDQPKADGGPPVRRRQVQPHQQGQGQVGADPGRPRRLPRAREEVSCRPRQAKEKGDSEKNF